jgi:hypothetical protein
MKYPKKTISMVRNWRSRIIGSHGAMDSVCSAVLRRIVGGVSHSCDIDTRLSVRMLPGLTFSLFFLFIPLLNRRKQKTLYAKSNALHGRLTLDVDDSGIQFGGPSSFG